MRSFQLEGEEVPPPLPTAAPVRPPQPAAAPPQQQQQTTNHANPPGGGAEFLQQFVTNAFDEIYRDEAPSAMPMEASVGRSLWREYTAQQDGPHRSGSHHQQTIAPSPEEQAWLDQEFDLVMEPCGEEAPASMHFPSEKEEEEAYIRYMLALHPALDEEEARWLYRQGQHLR
jgi:hypothetical protein